MHCLINATYSSYTVWREVLFKSYLVLLILGYTLGFFRAGGKQSALATA